MEGVKVFLGVVVLCATLGLPSVLADGDSPSLPYSFITQPQDVQAKEGEDVTFRCELEGTGIGMVVWTNNSMTISFGRQETYDNPRLAIEGTGNAYNMAIKDVGMMDEGEWECQVPGRIAIKQTNTLTIVVEPTITVEGGDVEAMEGDEVKLECTADGRPEPNIVWTKEGDAEFKQEGAELSFGSVKRENGGKYTCEATNGIGEGDRVSFDIDVMFPPTVEVREALIHTGPDDEVELTCVFTSNPDVNIIWRHNNGDINLEEGGRFRATADETGEDEQEATLTITNLQAEDLGMYTCMGGNGKGEASETIELSGLPYDVEFVSDANGEYSDSYTLQWEFTSVAAPTECQLKVTVQPDGTDFGENVVPSQVGSNNRHMQNFVVGGLTVDTQYGAKVNCKNEFGETGWSEEFVFNTSEHENPAPLPTTTLEPETEKPTTSPAQTTTLPADEGDADELAETTPSDHADQEITSELPVVDIDTDDDDKESDITDDSDDKDKSKDDDSKESDSAEDDDVDDGSDGKEEGGEKDEKDIVHDDSSASAVKPWELLIILAMAMAFNNLRQ